MLIQSVSNPHVREVLLLQQKSQERRRTGLYVLEGQRELFHALSHGECLHSLYICPQILGTQYESLLSQTDCPIYELSPTAYARIAYREGTEGVIALMRQRHRTLDGLSWQDPPLFVVLEGVEKPGNVGAVLRTADAAGVTAVLLADARTDLYNPNLIRSSLGSLFTVPTINCTSQQCISFLQHSGVQILTAQLQDSRLYYETDMRQGIALVMGTEATGLTQQWRQAATAHIRIPMLGSLDSLNVSVSAAILMYEAVRQRQKTRR